MEGRVREIAPWVVIPAHAESTGDPADWTTSVVRDALHRHRGQVGFEGIGGPRHSPG